MLFEFWISTKRSSTIPLLSPSYPKHPVVKASPPNLAQALSLQPAKCPAGVSCTCATN